MVFLIIQWSSSVLFIEHFIDGIDRLHKFLSILFHYPLLKKIKIKILLTSFAFSFLPLGIKGKVFSFDSSFKNPVNEMTTKYFKLKLSSFNSFRNFLMHFFIHFPHSISISLFERREFLNFWIKSFLKIINFIQFRQRWLQNLQEGL